MQRSDRDGYTTVASEESINTMNPWRNDDTRFLSEVHLLAGKQVLVVAIHPLGGSRANWHHTPNPQSGAAQPTQVRAIH